MAPKEPGTSAEGALLISKRSLRREALYGNVKVSQTVPSDREQSYRTNSVLPEPEARYRRIAAPKEPGISAEGALLISKRSLRREALYGNVKVSQNTNFVLPTSC